MAVNQLGGRSTTPPELTPEPGSSLGALVIRIASPLTPDASTTSADAGDLGTAVALPTAYAGLATPRTVIDGGVRSIRQQPVQTPAVASESGASFVGRCATEPGAGPGLKIAPRPVVSAVYVACPDA